VNQRPAPPLAGSTLGLIAVGVVAVSMSGPVMASLAVPALVISFWRNGLATLLLAPVALVRRRAEITGLSRSELGWIVGSGVCLAVHFGTWVTSLSMTSVASSTAIVCLQIAWVVAWDRFTGVRLPRRAVVGLVLAFLGVLVITGVDLSVSTRALAGDLLALAGSIAVAAYTVIGGRARRTVTTTSYTFVCYGTAALLLLVASLVSGAAVVGYGAREWALIVLVTLTSQLLGHSVFNYLLDRIRPVVVSLAILLEIPGAALIAGVFLGQLPPVGVFAGLGMILAGMALVILNGPDRSDEPAIADL
jgi:drug/metabolite transporter (DMT)-like permease